MNCVSDTLDTFTMTFPIILYILKDNIDFKKIKNNDIINTVLLLFGLFTSKNNFQGTVYIMFTFFMIQLLGQVQHDSSDKKKVSFDSSFIEINKKENFSPEREEVSENVEEEPRNDNHTSFFMGNENEYTSNFSDF